MSQINSQIYSKACTWDFSVEGDPFPFGAAGMNLGLQINPGESIWQSGFNIITPLASPTPLVDVVTIFYIIDLGATFRVLTDTVANINLLLGNTWFYNSANNSYAAGATIMQNPFAIATPGVYQIKISSTNTLTAGKIAANFNCVSHNIQ